MTLLSLENRKEFAGDDISTVFPFPNKFQKNADLKVQEIIDDTGVVTLKVETTDYTVTGAGLAAGGSVTMIVAPDTGVTLVIFRDPVQTQDLDLKENDALPAEPVEDTLDLLTMITQRLEDRANRSIRLNDAFSETFDLTLPTLLPANKALLTNPNGDGWIMGDFFATLLNPMTALEDLMVGGVSGAPVRLPKGALDTILTNIAGSLGYRLIPAASLATDAVETAKIKDDAVTTPKILDGAVTPAKFSFVPPFQEAFVSAEQTITTGAEVNLAHGLTSTPNLMDMFLINKIAELGYDVGDKVDLDMVDLSGGDPQTTFWVDDTNVNMKFGNGAKFRIIDKSGGGQDGKSTSITNANWKIIIHAWI